MAELRYNPLLGDWLMVASHRQARPQMPKDWCPFCPGSGRVPGEGYTVLRYPNDFPALSENPPEPDEAATDFYQTAPAYGRCEVLLYSPEHTKTLKELTDAHMHRLAGMWLETFRDMAADKKIKYVYLFENRGEPVGVTMPHPHGQAYGYPFVPKRLELETLCAEKHLADTGRCLFCDLLRDELRDGRRIIFRNEYFTVFLPFFAPVVYGIHIIANRHVHDMAAMTPEEIAALGETVRDCAGMLDALFDSDFPYMMCMHNAPVNAGDYSESFHFHVEFFPPMRSAQKQQFFASSETGAWAWCNPTCPELKAQELKSAYRKYMGRNRRKNDHQ